MSKTIRAVIAGSRKARAQAKVLREIAEELPGFDFNRKALYEVADGRETESKKEFLAAIRSADPLEILENAASIAYFAKTQGYMRERLPRVKERQTIFPSDVGEVPEEILE